MTAHTAAGHRSHTVIDSPIGPLTLVACDGRLAGLYMATTRHAPSAAALGACLVVAMYSPASLPSQATSVSGPIGLSITVCDRCPAAVCAVIEFPSLYCPARLTPGGG